MRRIPQASSYTVMLKLFASSDHVSAATGKTVAIKLSKAGGAFGNPNAGATNATEVSNGWYKVALDTTDTGTLGDLVVRGTATGCDDCEQVMQIAQTADDYADALLDQTDGVESGLTVRGALRIALSALAGKVSGAGTGTETFRNVGDSKDRITATVDSSGNRTAITTDAS